MDSLKELKNRGLFQCSVGSMPRGGARPGAGRKPKLKLPGVTRDIAQAILAGQDEMKCWIELLAANDQRLRFDVLRYLTDRRDGKPMIRVAANVSGMEGLAERMAEARRRLDSPERLQSPTHTIAIA